MKTTTNYGFKQPEGTDIVNIDDISDNFGSVDTEIKKANDKVIAHEGKGGTVHADVTTTTSGFMSASDKTKLNGIATGANKVESSTTNGNIKINGTETNVYTHPTGTNPHGTTKADIGLSNVTNDSQVKRSEMGVANGVSTLDTSGVNKQPPASHASTGTSYGVADSSNYGHVKIGNGIAVSSGTISVDVGDGVVLSGTSPNQKLVADVGTGLTLEGTSPNKKIALSNSGVTAGTYEKVTVDAKGRITSGGDLTASDVPNIPWSKITSGKPTTLEGYGIIDSVKKLDAIDSPTNAYWFSGGGLGLYGLHMHNSDIVGLNALVFNDATDASMEGINFPKTTTTVGSTNTSEYDVLDVLDGNLRLNGKGVQQHRLTTNEGYVLSTTGITDFNDINETGNYSISSSSTMTNAPTGYTSGIYGTLYVQRRTSTSSTDSLVQIFISTTGSNMSMRAKNSGIWNDWRRIAMFDDFESSTDGYQRLPSGQIIQWGSTPIEKSTSEGRKTLSVSLPIAFPSIASSVVANIVTVDNSPTYNYLYTANAYINSARTIITLGITNLTASTNGSSIRVQWIAIGK